MESKSYLGISGVWRPGVVIGFAGLGLVMGWFLPTLVHWALDLPWVPFHGPLRLLESIPEPGLQFGGAGVGLLAGGWFGVMVIVETLMITVTDHDVALRIKGKTQTLTRAQIGSAFLDGKLLVLLDPAGRELARDKPEESAAKVEKVFRAHGYPWMAADPHLSEYRLWVPDTPGLPEGANALLTARSRALDKKQADDVAELRREVTKLGVMVRDDGTRQYWRKLRSS
jgi:hypothetical protein